MLLLRSLILLTTCWAWASPSVAATSLAELFLQTPAPPPDGPTAKAWVRDGQIVAPELLRFEARLQQEKVSSAKIAVSVAAAADPPAVLVAVRGYESYRSQNSGDADPAKVLAKRTAWIAKRFDGVRKRMGSQAVGDHNAVDDELRAWSGLFRDWQQSRRPLVDKAALELAALGDVPVVSNPANAEAIKAYRIAIFHEIETQASITRLAVERLASAP